jgi:SET domain-containing protein
MAAFVVRHSPIHGTGVFAARDIAAEEEIIEYAGRRLTYAEADALYPDDNGHTFLYELNGQYMIDAAVDGNDARWINHSCDPNCEVYLEEDEGGDPARDRLVICAMRAIRAGEELTYDYGIVTREPITDEERALWACRCGAPNCKGLMLEYVPGPQAGGGP